ATLRRLSEHWFDEEIGRPREESPAFWRFSTTVVLPRILLGMLLTLKLTLVSGLGGMALGLSLALARVWRRGLVRRGALAYVTLFRGPPLLLQIFFIFYGLPPLLGIRLGALTAGVLALSLNLAAYVSEIMRAAIESVDRGQVEAARALGMTHGQA